MQTINKPLKAHRHFHQLATQRVDHTVNHSGRDQRFTHRDLFAPLRTVLEEIIDCNSQVVVRVHQPGRGDDTVTVVVRVVGKRQIELVAQRQQASHCAFGGAVHTDRAVFVQVHKAEGLIDVIVHDGQIQLVVLGNALPVFNTGAAKRIHAQLQTGFLNSGHIDNIRQPFHERLHQILLFHVAGGHGFIQRDTLHAVQTVSQ